MRDDAGDFFEGGEGKQDVEPSIPIYGTAAGCNCQHCRLLTNRDSIGSFKDEWTFTWQLAIGLERLACEMLQN
jgi:hypothetical protein